MRSNLPRVRGYMATMAKFLSEEIPNTLFAPIVMIIAQPFTMHFVALHSTAIMSRELIDELHPMHSRKVKKNWNIYIYLVKLRSRREVPVLSTFCIRTYTHLRQRPAARESARFLSLVSSITYVAIIVCATHSRVVRWMNMNDTGSSYWAGSSG